MKLNKDNLIIGIEIICLTFIEVLLLTIYENETGNRIGWYAFGFVPLVFLGLFCIGTAFKKKGNKDE